MFRLSRLPATAIVATVGALGGWWWQNRAQEVALTERTRARLRPWGTR